MAMLRRLLITISQQKHPLVRAPFVLASKQYSLSANDDSWAQKHKRYFKETFGISENEKVSLKHVYKVMEKLDKEKTFDPNDVKAIKYSFMKLMNFLGVTDEKEMTFEEYFESIKTKLENNELTLISLSDELTEAIFNCIDSNKDGFILYDEWLIYMRLLNFSTSEEIKQVFDALDTNCDGKLSLEEFIPINRGFYLNTTGATTTDKLFGSS